MQIQLTPTWPAFRNSYILLHATVSPSIHPSIHPLVVQWLNHVQLLATPRTSTGQAPLSFTMSWSVLKLMSFESVVLSKHLILCHTLHLFPSVLPSIRVFSNKSALLIRWLKYWSFSISPSVNIQGWFPLGWGFPYSSAGKEPSCKAGDLGSIPGLGRSPGEGKSYPLQYSDLENSMDWIHKESDTTEQLSLSLSNKQNLHNHNNISKGYLTTHSNVTIIIICERSAR